MKKILSFVLLLSIMLTSLVSFTSCSEKDVNEGYITDEQREDRANIVASAMDAMTDERKAEFAKQVNADNNIKVNGKKVIVDKDGSIALGGIKNKINKDENPELYARVQSRLFGAISEEDKKSAVKQIKVEEKKGIEDSATNIRKAEIMDKKFDSKLLK